MKNLSKILVLSIDIIMGIAMVCAMLFCFPKLEWFIQIFAYACILIFSVGTIVGFGLGKESLMKSCFTLNCITFIIVAMFTILNLCGVFDTLSDIEKIKDLILKSGHWSYLIYFLLQLLNVVILPLPGFLFLLAAVALFGAWKAFWISYFSVLVGSVIAFMLGRFCGKKIAVWTIGEELTNKYSDIMGKRGYVPFVIMQILPFFPDDILCIIAGMSSMSWKFFLISMILIRPIYIATVCFLGTGSIIPFSGWGIPVWIGICAVILTLFILYSKNQKKIENWLKSKSHKNSKED